MDQNQDGVVTIDEFLETCQKVGGIKGREHPVSCPCQSQAFPTHSCQPQPT